MADEFDLSFFQNKPLDHGCFSPLSVLWPHDGQGWPGAIVPLQIGVLQAPVPSARRCWKLGQALRRAVESAPDDLKVAIVATGGLSHQVHGERAGFNNTAWDREFLDLLERDPETLADITQAEYARLGGFESAEVIMWLVMRGALSARVRKVHEAYTLPSMTGIAVAIYENEAAEPTPGTQAARAIEASRQAHRERMGVQSAGLDRIEGTYPYTLARSIKGFRINQFLHGLIEPGFRQRFLADEESCFEQAGPQRRGARPDPPPRLARPDPLRRDLLRAGEARRGGRVLEPAHLRRHARRVARRFPQDTQCARRPVFGGRQERRAGGLGWRRVEHLGRRSRKREIASAVGSPAALLR